MKYLHTTRERAGAQGKFLKDNNLKSSMNDFGCLAWILESHFVLFSAAKKDQKATTAEKYKLVHNISPSEQSIWMNNLYFAPPVDKPTHKANRLSTVGLG